MREKMSLSQRAKQFLPFDAVQGFRQALKAKEYEVEAIAKASPKVAQFLNGVTIVKVIYVKGRILNIVVK